MPVVEAWPEGMAQPLLSPGRHASPFRRAVPSPSNPMYPLLTLPCSLAPGQAEDAPTGSEGAKDDVTCEDNQTKCSSRCCDDGEKCCGGKCCAVGEKCEWGSPSTGDPNSSVLGVTIYRCEAK